MLNTKEQVLFYFLTDKIRLNIYDKQFCNNLQEIILSNNKITSNQKNLFDKLILKYKKQLSKQNLNAYLLLELSWKTSIIESDPNYLVARVFIKDNWLIFRVPFNKNFISEFKTIKDNPFEWDRKNKFYISTLSTHALKLIHNTLPKYFDDIKYDISIQKILNNLSTLENSIWEPTLVKINNFYLIAPINESLYNVTKHINLNEEVDTLFTLSQYGIKVEDKIVKDDHKKLFASNTHPTIDLQYFEQCAKWLKELNVEVVSFGRGMNGLESLGDLINKKFGKKNNIYNSIEKILKKYNLKVIKNKEKFYLSSYIGNTVVIQTYSSLITIYHDKNKKVSKYITLTNSMEINVA